MKIEGGIGKLQQVFEAGVFECLGRWWRGVLRKLKGVFLLNSDISIFTF